MKNLMPLPYRRVAVHHYDGDLSEIGLRKYFIGKEVYFATDYVVVGTSNKTSIVEIKKEIKEGLFVKVEAITRLAGPENCVRVADENIDVANPSAMAAKAKSLGISSSSTLIVEGAYGHVNFLLHPEPARLRVVDLIPPGRSRMLDLVVRALELGEFPPLLIEPVMIDVNGIAAKLGSEAVMFPCRASGLSGGGQTSFLDERPADSSARLVGCERTEEIYEHIYKIKPNRIETCPRKIDGAQTAPTIMRCCVLQNSVELKGLTATVPWGADVKHVIEALQRLCAAMEPRSKKTGTSHE